MAGSSDGGTRSLPLRPMPVAEFYARVLDLLDQLGIEAPIRPHPNEVDPAIPFAEDHTHTSYGGEAAALFRRRLLAANRVIGDFRSHVVGEVSPVHFFWGGMDLACTRFSGRPAPPHPGGVPNCGDWVMVEGYSGELSSCGFWPGGGEEGAFCSYAYPAPDGFAEQPVGPDGAFHSPEFQQFLLPYEVLLLLALRHRHGRDGARGREGSGPGTVGEAPQQHLRRPPDAGEASGARSPTTKAGLRG